jgi:patatin-like phospholipase/acyl hydrolase
MTAERFQILSLDGGGLKGLFTASFLANWEKETGKRVVDHFDLIAGTSTGGIIALGLGLGLSAEQIKNLYIEKAELIFPPTIFSATKHWVSEKYTSEGLQNALKELFGDKRLGDSSTRLLIPAFDPKFHGIHIFKTAHHRRLRTDYKQTAVHVALATSAAPTYLPAEMAESGLQLVDGGVWANNPVSLAVVEALDYLGSERKNIFALRIGTTSEVVSKDLKISGGKLAMVAPVIEFMMRGQAQAASGMVMHLISKDHFHEIDPMVAPGDYHLDKLSKELVAMGAAEWRHQSSELMDLGFLDHTASAFEPTYSLEQQ